MGRENREGATNLASVVSRTAGDRLPCSRLTMALDVNIANLVVEMFTVSESDDRDSLLRLCHGEGIIESTRRINLE